MDSRTKRGELRQIAGTIAPEDFDLRAASGQQQRLPRALHDGTGQAWVSSLQTFFGDYALSSRYDFGRAAVLDDFRAGWLDVRSGDLPPCERTLARWLQRPEGAAVHRLGSFVVTHPNSAYHLGRLAALNYNETLY